jgi:hypothetical protein
MSCMLPNLTVLSSRTEYAAKVVNEILPFLSQARPSLAAEAALLTLPVEGFVAAGGGPRRVLPSGSPRD